MRVLIKPLHGLLVRDPKTYEALPVEGAEKRLSSFWLRREKDGSVEILRETRKNISGKDE